jgi:hypothetical protein
MCLRPLLSCLTLMSVLGPSLLMTASVAAEPAAAAEPVPIRLIAQPDLGAGLAAFPRIASAASSGAASEGDAHAVARINQALADADSRLRAAAKDCQAQAHEGQTSGAQAGEAQAGGAQANGAQADGAQTVGTQANPQDAGWQRSVTVAMIGPFYLSLVASDQWDCGGAYPDAASFALEYDLRTGSPLNWARLLPKALVGTASLDTAGDGTRIGVAASAALTKLYLTLAKPDADCASALREADLQFMLWPDAARDGVAMQPSGLPHAIAACGDDAVIPLATLRTLGAEPGLVSAIEAGHRGGLFGMTR